MQDTIVARKGDSRASRCDRVLTSDDTARTALCVDHAAGNMLF